MNNEMNLSRMTPTSKKISVFLFLTLLISSFFWFMMGSAGNYYLYMTGLMWSPGISAILTLLIFRNKLAEFDLRWGKSKTIILSYLFPFGYLLLTYGLIWGFGLGDFNLLELNSISEKLGLQSKVISALIYTGLLGLFGLGSYLFAAAGEELGWRGFLLKNLLKNNSPIRSSLLVGVIWGIWHFPLFHLNGLEITTSNWFPLLNFFLMVICLSFVYTWFFLKSKNLWTSILLHTSHNLFLQRFFAPMTLENEHTSLFADETGLMIMIILLIIAALMAFQFHKIKIL